MTTELTTQKVQTREEVLNLMRPVSERLGSEAAAQNKILLAFELDVVSRKVQRFGWDDMAEAMKDRLTSDWVDALEPFPIAEVKRAIGDCLTVTPNKCPTEHAVRAAIQDRRAKAVRSLPKPPEPVPERTEPTPEEKARVAELVRQVGMEKKI